MINSSQSTTKGAMISTMAITDTAEGNEDDIMLIVGDSFGFIFLFDISGYCLMAAEEDPPECMYQPPLTVTLYS